MTREKRNYYEGGVYHIIQRGNNKAYIFNDQVDKVFLYELASKVMATDPYYMLAYVLMDNHYHFLMEMKEVPIDRVMHKLNMRYSKYFNKKYERVGTIFSERYKCVPIETQAQYYRVLQYILFNPVKAGIVHRPEQYRWSSHFEFEKDEPVLLSKERLLCGLADAEDDAQRIYKELLSTGLDQIKVDWRGNEVVRMEQPIELFFKKWCEEQEIRKMIRERDLSKLVVAERTNFVTEALEQGYRTSEIAKVLNFTQRGIRRIRGMR